MDTSALITIEEVVQGFLFKGDWPEGFKGKITQIAIDGYRELNLVVLPQGRNVEKFTMDSNYIIYIPADIILINSVSIPLEGKMWTLTLSTDMVPTTSLENGAEVLDEDWGEGVDLSDKGVAYASKGGVNNYGYYCPDYKKRRILFKNVDRSDVILDYMSSGVSLTDTTYIPVEAKAALEAYVRLYMEYNKITPHPTMISVHRDEFERQKSILRLIKFNMVDFLDTVYKTYATGIYR